MQVLEHVPDAQSFAQKLLEVSKVVIGSVPYKWPKGHTESHIHDPVDEAKLLAWFGRKPYHSHLCREVTAEVHRLVQVYDRFDSPWNSLNHRARLLNDHRAGRSKATPAIRHSPFRRAVSRLRKG